MLIACLLVAEQNNELLLKNHQSHPTRSMALPLANAISVSIIDVDVDVDTTMVKVVAMDVVAIILGIVIAMVHPKTRKMVSITRS